MSVCAVSLVLMADFENKDKIRMLYSDVLFMVRVSKLSGNVFTQKHTESRLY